MTKNLILDKEEILQKIRRIAFEIYENNFEEEALIIAGVYDKGYIISDILLKELQKIFPGELKLIKVSLDKFAPLQSEISLDISSDELHKKTIILTDDVLNTGRTLAYSLKPFLNAEIKKIQTVVLVDRGYKSFPVSADYVGYSLATTLKDHVEVNLEKDSFGVYLH